MKHDSKNQVEALALERIYRLFSLADEEFALHPERSHRYVSLALKIGTKNRARIPAELKTAYCKKCHHFLKNKKNAKIESKANWMEITCLDCKTAFKRRKNIRD